MQKGPQFLVSQHHRSTCSISSFGTYDNNNNNNNFNHTNIRTHSVTHAGKDNTGSTVSLGTKRLAAPLILESNDLYISFVNTC